MGTVTLTGIRCADPECGYEFPNEEAAKQQPCPGCHKYTKREKFSMLAKTLER